MSILTNLPVTSVCGTPVVVTVDKAQFVTDFGIVDPYWSNPANWQEIEFYYVDDTGPSQVKKMSFAGNTYALNLKTNIYNGNMLCQKVTIMDGNGAVLAFARASFPIAAEFDFAVTGGYPSVTTFPFIRDFANPNTQQSYEVLTTSTITGGLLDIGTAGYYENQNPDIDYQLGVSYTIRIHLNAHTFGDLIIYSSGSHFLTQIPAATLNTYIGSFFDVVFTANGTDVGSITKLFLLTDGSNPSTKISKVEFIQNP